ncbi:MAG: GPR endopeptidase [Lachnospiraceae bacterium]
MEYFRVRTDLALEAREFIEEADGEIRGVIAEEYDEKDCDVHVTKVVINSKNGAKAMGKPIGTYITLEAAGLSQPDEDYHREVSVIIAKHLQELLPKPGEEKSILVVGLGNRDVTADALGPGVVDNLYITRHMLMQFGKAAYECEKINQISAVIPGVMGKTGMESAEIVKGIVKQTKPDVIVAIDALAARNTRRLNRTIQLTNTGIHPGSGVGNHRDSITQESLGVPVIAIGIPTVVDAATIVSDAIERMKRELGENDMLFSGEGTGTLAELNNMYVTSKDIDATIKRLGYTLSEGLNIAFDLNA